RRPGPASPLAGVDLGRWAVSLEGSGRAGGGPSRAPAGAPSAPAPIRPSSQRRICRMTALPHSLDRSVVIRARPGTVFRYFTDSTRFASWWGEGSSIDARPGGAVRIVYPGGVVVIGNVVTVKPTEQISFTYGYESKNSELVPAGGSLVTVTVEPHPDGTLLHL